jgi:hypothetical protein
MKAFALKTLHIKVSKLHISQVSWLKSYLALELISYMKPNYYYMEIHRNRIGPGTKSELVYRSNTIKHTDQIPALDMKNIIGSINNLILIPAKSVKL